MTETSNRCEILISRLPLSLTRKLITMLKHVIMGVLLNRHKLDLLLSSAPNYRQRYGNVLVIDPHSIIGQ